MAPWQGAQGLCAGGERACCPHLSAAQAKSWSPEVTAQVAVPRAPSPALQKHTGQLAREAEAWPARKKGGNRTMQAGAEASQPRCSSMRAPLRVALPAMPVARWSCMPSESEQRAMQSAPSLWAESCLCREMLGDKGVLAQRATSTGSLGPGRRRAAAHHRQSWGPPGSLTSGSASRCTRVCMRMHLCVCAHTRACVGERTPRGLSLRLRPELLSLPSLQRSRGWGCRG